MQEDRGNCPQKQHVIEAFAGDPTYKQRLIASVISLELELRARWHQLAQHQCEDPPTTLEDPILDAIESHMADAELELGNLGVPLVKVIDVYFT